MGRKCELLRNYDSDGNLISLECGTCHEVKAVSEFNKCKGMKDGIGTRCKDCRKEYRKQNADKIKEYSAEYYNQNADKRKNKMLIREKNKMLIREKNKMLNIISKTLIK